MAEHEPKANGNVDGMTEQATGVRPNTKSKKAKKSARRRQAPISGRRPGAKPYPVLTFDEVLRFGQGVAEIGSGHPVKRDTLFEKLQLRVNRRTKDLITASGRYGITIGSHSAAEYRLTEKGATAVVETPSVERIKARIKLAVVDIGPFNQLYERFKGGKMPAVEVMRDSLDELNETDRSACVDVFVQNAKFVGLLQTREGAEFLVTVEEAIASAGIHSPPRPLGTGESSVVQTAIGEDFDSVCFFIAPIGDDDSEYRRHSDAILSSYVEKALATVEPKLRVVRADKITQPGLITKQVLEYLLKSRLVVADLSYHNPNVFYELAVRHATGKPVIHIKRTSDPIPFDNKDFRTIDIAFDDKFDILAQMETNRSSIAQFSRQSLSAGDSSENPLLIYFPDFRFAKIK